jgi:tripartite-type tricarboxylate transporter receptor subunit TctC
MNLLPPIDPDRRAFTAGLGLALSMPFPMANAAEHRLIRMVVPFSAGSSVDALARLVCARLSHHLAAPVVIDNRPGAGGCLGAASASRETPDGTHLFCGTAGTHGINPAIYSRPGYDPVRNFEPVIGVASSSNVMVTHPGLGVGSLTDFVALARTRPGALNMGSEGVGTTAHLSGVLFNRAAGIDTIHVPSRSGAIIDVVAGRLDYSFEPLASALPFVRTGQVLPLVVTAPRRETAIPDVPTIAEAGYPDCAVTAWAAFFAPHGVSRDFVEWVNQGTNRALAEPDVQRRIGDIGGMPIGGSPDDLRRRVAVELARWPSVVRSAGIRIDQPG